MNRTENSQSKRNPRPAGSRFARRAVVFALAFTATATAQEVTVDEQQLEQLENIFILVWYFTLFCAFAAGVKTGLAR